ncbi:MAG: hypothetical protein HS122_14035 [Opitutaceae bacterium]|nr:hypothetical protein [Opitutaceae bacterium]
MTVSVSKHLNEAVDQTRRQEAAKLARTATGLSSRLGIWCLDGDTRRFPVECLPGAAVEVAAWHRPAGEASGLSNGLRRAAGSIRPASNLK